MVNFHSYDSANGYVDLEKIAENMIDTTQRNDAKNQRKPEKVNSVLVSNCTVGC